MDILSEGQRRVVEMITQHLVENGWDEQTGCWIWMQGLLAYRRDIDNPPDLTNKKPPGKGNRAGE